MAPEGGMLWAPQVNPSPRTTSERTTTRNRQDMKVMQSFSFTKAGYPFQCSIELGLRFEDELGCQA
jgi:hypothetical protein